jgi:hypothetical protein
MKPSSRVFLSVVGFVMVSAAPDGVMAAPSLSRAMVSWHIWRAPAGIGRGQRAPLSHEGRFAASPPYDHHRRDGSHGETLLGDAYVSGPFEDNPPDVAASKAAPQELPLPPAGALSAISEERPTPIDTMLRRTARPQILVVRPSRRARRRLPVVIYGSVVMAAPR